MNDEVRPLTPEELDKFPGDSSVNVAIKSSDGNWYYGDAVGPLSDETYEEVGFVTNEDGDYIPVS